MDRSSLVRKWLAVEGQFRNEAVHEASRLLLQEYMRQWEHLIPVELHRLAATLRSEIVRIKELEGEAILMPSQEGFRILVNATLPTGRYRTSIAHELAHTLFYTDSEEYPPCRCVPHSQQEEDFCFDVARNLLAPKEHLEAIGILRESDPAVIFKKLTGVLLLSRPLAARLMLAELTLARGIAGRWVRTASGWKQQYPSSTATPSLSQRERGKLRMVASQYLQCPGKQPHATKIISVDEKSGEGIFLVVTTL